MKNRLKKFCNYAFSTLPIRSNQPIDKFTVDDTINFVGLFIINDKARNLRKYPGYAATVSWKLVYSINNMEGVTPGRYGICNFLTDGWIYPIGNTKEDVCNYLNKSGEKFRIMTKQEVTYLINSRDQGFK